MKKQIETRLLQHVTAESNSGEDSKRDIWARPLLRRKEQKPTLINVIPSIHPKEFSEKNEKRSFVSSLRKTFDKEKGEKNEGRNS